MHRTRSRVLIGLGAVLAALLLSASAPATATSGPGADAVYCDYLGHLQDPSDR